MARQPGPFASQDFLLKKKELESYGSYVLSEVEILEKLRSYRSKVVPNLNPGQDTHTRSNDTPRNGHTHGHQIESHVPTVTVTVQQAGWSSAGWLFAYPSAYFE